MELETSMCNLVKKIARATCRGTDYDDRVSEGYTGLLVALGRYDPSKGPFKAYAKHRIRGAIIDAARRDDWVNKYDRQRQNCHGITPDNIMVHYEDVEGFEPSVESTDDDRVMYRQHLAMMHSWIEALPERYKEVVTMRLDGMTTREIGDRLGITDSRVSQVYSLAVHHLQIMARLKGPRATEAERLAIWR